MGAPKTIGGFKNPAHRIQQFGNKKISGIIHRQTTSPEERARQAEEARRREAGKPAQGDALNILGNTEIDVRDKISLVNDLVRTRKIGVDRNQTDSQFGDEEAALRHTLGDSFHAIAGNNPAFQSVKARFAALVKSSRESKAKFESNKKTKLDLPGQSQVRNTTVLGGNN